MQNLVQSIAECITEKIIQNMENIIQLIVIVTVQEKSLLVKSGQLLSMYDIVPGNTLHSNKDIINWDRAKLIAHKLVDDFNAISDKQGYKKIKYVEA